MIHAPLILYVPGLLPKPEPTLHRDALRRCLLAGLGRVDQHAAREIQAEDVCFDVVSWTFDFYGEHRDFALDSAAVDAVIAQAEASPTDIAEASSWRRRFARQAYTMGDLLPFLIPHLANERMELHLRDLRRYVQNSNDIAEHIRQMLKMPLRAAAESDRPLLLLAHSMGSVIAFEVLWQLSREVDSNVQVDLLLTMGSPLGQRFIQKRLLGHERSGKDRYPDNVARWINLSAVGDLTAIDPYLGNDYGEMVDAGLVESIDDRIVHNHFRLDGELNTHAEYGYMVNTETAGIIADWWRTVSAIPLRDSAG